MIDLVQRIQHLENEMSVSKQREEGYHYNQEQQIEQELAKKSYGGNHRKRKL
jgi:hypothetical protein